MTPDYDWAGQLMKPGGFYGGRVENIPPTWGKKPALAVAKHFEVITESDVCEVFGGGAHKLTRVEAATLLEARTGAHRTSAYRALRRFAGHLDVDGVTLSWR